MRIGVDARPLSYQLSGIGFYLKSLLDALQQVDQKNVYFLISNATIEYSIFNSKWSCCEGRFKKKLTSTLWMQVMAPILVSKNNIDLFWSPRHHLPVFLPKAIKTVLTIHDVIHHKYPRTLTLPNLLVERILMRQSIKRANRIIADSLSTAFDIQTAYRIHSGIIETIYPGVPNFMNDGDVSDNIVPELPDKYFLFVGTMDPRKNLNRIIKAFNRIDPVSRNLHLVIAGGQGWKNNKFLDELADLPARANIHVMGYISRRALMRYYKNSMCLLFPSLYEGFGFPILEAMSLGTPVITGNSSSMPEVADDAAVIVDPFDEEEIADAMLEMIDNKVLRDRLIDKGKRRARQFSWTDCAKEFMQVCESVIES